jgi:hypothetical protein
MRLGVFGVPGPSACCSSGFVAVEDRLLLLVAVMNRMLLSIAVVDRVVVSDAFRMHVIVPCASDGHATRFRCRTCRGHTAYLSMTISRLSRLDIVHIPASIRRLGI